MRSAIKRVARGVALLAVTPSLLSFALKRFVLGPDGAIEGSTQTLSMIPGLVGDYMRAAFLGRTLAHCAPTARVQFGTIFSQAGARIDDYVYVGPRCHLGLVHLEKDVLLAAGVHVPSGGATHGTEALDVPIREQPQTRSMVRIGEGTWVGSAAVIMDNVGKHCVIGAGAVVTKPLPDYVIAVGVPARIIRHRLEASTAAGG